MTFVMFCPQLSSLWHAPGSRQVLKGSSRSVRSSQKWMTGAPEIGNGGCLCGCGEGGEGKLTYIPNGFLSITIPTALAPATAPAAAAAAPAADYPSSSSWFFLVLLHFLVLSLSVSPSQTFPFFFFFFFSLFLNQSSFLEAHPGFVGNSQETGVTLRGP